MVTSQRHGVLSNIDFYINNGAKRRARECFFSGGALYKKGILGARKVTNADVVLNCCHGGVGEDGRLAGMMEILGIPITSCPSAVAAVLQSKTRTREVLSKNGFDQPKVGVSDFPCIVKPDSLGSSIGISVVRDQEGLGAAVDLAKSLDDEIIIEEFLENAIEVNCSAFKFGDKVLVSGCEVMEKTAEMLDFKSKYIDEGSGFIKKSGREEKCEYEEEIKELTKKAYEIFGAHGIVRADFLVVPGDGKARVVLNEINTVPGFLSYHLWQKVGIPYATLIEMLVDETLRTPKSGKKTDFPSEILQKNRFLVQ